MILQRLEIKGLFGTFDYDINFTEVDSPFIITGPNGYGKTTILTIIDNLAKKDLFYFYVLPFSFVRLYLENEFVLKIDSEYIDDNTTEEGYSKVNSSRKVLFRWENTKGVKVSSIVLDKKSIEKALAYKRWGYRVGYSSTYSFNSEEFYREIKSQKGYEDFAKYFIKGGMFQMLLESLKTTFIEAQRLIREKSNEEDDDEEDDDLIQFDNVRGESYTYAIIEVSRKLKKDLTKERNQFLKEAQKIDSGWVDKLLTHGDGLDYHEYAKLKQKLDEQIDELVAFNLLEPIVIKSYSDESHKVALSVYINNLQDKLKTYDNIRKKLQLFKDVLSSLKLVHKHVSFSPDYGLRVQNDEGKYINLTRLSSGEQHEIVMLYYIIFKVPDKTLLLIDEPEISLHVCWQNEFLGNLSRIARIKNLQVIVATHSPQIIGDRWEDCYDLCENSISDE